LQLTPSKTADVRELSVTVPEPDTEMPEDVPEIENGFEDAVVSELMYAVFS
jgi:hypothetical protein